MSALKQFLLRPYLYLIIILIGTVLKFYRVDFRFFWFDEICTIVQTSGIPQSEFNKMVPWNEIKSSDYYNDLLHLNKHDYTIASQLKGMSQIINLNPLHYSLLVFWHRLVGDDGVHYRLFNVFLFILTLPILFLLVKTLFQSNLAGWIAVSFFSVSPFFHYYAHEARYNILCTFLLILCHYLLLQALKHNKLKWWIGYSIVGILSLYATILSGTVLLGHFVYVMIFKKEFLFKYTISGFFIFLGYLPWLISVIQHRSKIFSALSWHKYYGENQNILKLIIAQLTNAARSYVTLNDFWSHMDLLISGKFDGNYLQMIAMLSVIAAIIYSIIYAFRKLNKDVSYFLALIILPQFVLFLISDTFRGTGCSLIIRYHVINIIGISLFVAYLLGRKMTEGKIMYTGIYLGLVILGLVSISNISRDKFWDIPLYLEAVDDAEFISSSPMPLLISDFSFWYGSLNAFLALPNAIEKQDIDILRASPDIDNVREKISPGKYSELYVIHASDKLVENLRSEFPGKIDSVKAKNISPMWQIIN